MYKVVCDVITKFSLSTWECFVLFKCLGNFLNFIFTLVGEVKKEISRESTVHFFLDGAVTSRRNGTAPWDFNNKK